MNRPDHLPDFGNPPLDEVVLGIQFQTPAGYQQIFAGEVWDLYREKFPSVQEMQALPPQFETFGFPDTMRGVNFGVVTGASHDRFWFLTESADQLIQFQHDRLLHNWRKIHDGANVYPRFETIFEEFSSEIGQLEEYFWERFKSKINVSQCEITYLNNIEVGSPEDWRNASRWIRILSTDNSFDYTDFNIAFRQIIRNSEGRPVARLYCESGTAISRTGKAVIALNLTLRGAPDNPSVQSALEFLSRARDIMVMQFAQITTDSAHEAWGRLR